MDIDLAIMVQKLNEAVNESSFVPTVLNEYVLQHIWEPLCQGEEILFAELDFTQFSREDLDDAEDRAYQCTRLNDRIEGLNRHFCLAKPVGVSHRSFC